MLFSKFWCDWAVSENLFEAASFFKSLICTHGKIAAVGLFKSSASVLHAFQYRDCGGGGAGRAVALPLFCLV